MPSVPTEYVVWWLCMCALWAFTFAPDLYETVVHVRGWFRALLVMLCLSGCIRSVTTCVTYDHTLGRADPNSGLARNSTGASVCVEHGPHD